MPREPYPSDLTDAQWRAVEPLIPPQASGGRKREVDMREVVNSIRYLQAAGCKWRGLPEEFPNRSTVRHYFDAWRQSGLWAQIEAAIVAVSSPAMTDCPGDEEPPKRHDTTS